MGLFMDSLEDNTDRLDGFLYPPERWMPDPSKLPVIELLCCPICSFHCLSEDELKIHMTDVHSGKHIYLIINGKVIRDMSYVSEEIDSCELRLTGFNKATVTIQTDDVVEIPDVRNEGSLDSYIPESFEGEILISVGASEYFKKEFRILYRKSPRFRQALMDQEVSNLQLCLENEGAICSPEKWRDELIIYFDSNYFERRYIDAFMEYSLGMKLYMQDKKALSKERLESAYGLLEPFSSEMAQMARCILGVKMNCFSPLKRCKACSPFSVTKAFFIDGCLTWHRPDCIIPDTGRFVFADNFTTLFIKCVETYYSGTDEQFLESIDSLRSHPGYCEASNEDKVRLLAARFWKKKGETEKAREEYLNLRYHYLFKKEAEEALE